MTGGTESRASLRAKSSGLQREILYTGEIWYYTTNRCPAAEIYFTPQQPSSIYCTSSSATRTEQVYLKCSL